MEPLQLWLSPEDYAALVARELDARLLAEWGLACAETAADDIPELLAA